MGIALSLYCTGKSEWKCYFDAQLWASGGIHENPIPGWDYTATLQPIYGSSAALYRVNLLIVPEIEPGWISARASLMVNGSIVGGGVDTVPLSWYIGCPTDWPSGLARFPEVQGEDDQTELRKVWTLAARRSR